MTNKKRRYEWFNEVGYDVDLVRLHARFPSVGWASFSDWCVGALAPMGAS